jgi:dynein intermediate chain 2
MRRSVTKINWHPDANEGRVAVAYAKLKFQSKDSTLMPKHSYIWNLTNPNVPEKTLEPNSPLCTITYNPKIPENIVGGAYDGSLNFFANNVGHSSGVLKPQIVTTLENSHHDPVYDVYWQASGKVGKECVSTSTDGYVLWWDMRMPNMPTEKHQLTHEFDDGNGNKSTKVLGGTSMEYNADAGPQKFLIGTEQGYILNVNKRKQIETNFRFGTQMGKHHGPVYALERNPFIHKYFMSVGDWQAKMWCEEGVFNPIM